MKAVTPREALSQFVSIDKYSRFLPALNRRETKEEGQTRMVDMHRRRWPQLAPQLDWIEKKLHGNAILGSQRAWQFGGAAIERVNMRSYNCSFSLFDRPDFLKECVWLLLCGCGTGFSVQRQHVAKLPRIRRGTPRLHVVQDSIEGWADAFGALLAEPTTNFDYSLVRPEGAKLSSTPHPAPGPEPLRRALENCRALLMRVIDTQNGYLRPVDAFDLVMFAAECVRSGGVRRSATIALFSKDDEDMLNAKTGDWWKTNPQRRLANISAVFLRDDTDVDAFNRVFDSTREFGEPGFLFVNDLDHGVNPCFVPDTRLATDAGWVRLGDVVGEEQNVVTDARVTREGGDFDAEDGTVVRAASAVKLMARDQPVFEVRTRHGHKVKVTADHKFQTARGKIRLDEMTVGDELLLMSGRGGFGTVGNYDDGLLLGLVVSDGHYTGNKACLALWGDDASAIPDLERRFDVRFGEGTPTQGGVRVYRATRKTLADRLARYVDGDLRQTKRRVPDAVFRGSEQFVKGYLHGMFFGDGSVQCYGETTAATASLRLSSVYEDLLLDVQTLLSSFGVVAAVYPRTEAHKTELPDGRGGVKEYDCQPLFELVINRPNMVAFEREIGLYGQKAAQLKAVLDKRGRDCRKPEHYKTTVTAITPAGVSDVYCLHEPETHSLIVDGGLVTGNCVEIGLDPVLVLDDGSRVTGWSMCNLSTVNVAACATESDFYAACEAAALLGTLQAAYTDTTYLGAVTKAILERDALIGVSLTGIADRPEIGLDPDILQNGADAVVAVNAYFAQVIGIRAAARATCVKPEGTGSLALGGVASGSTPHHAERYLRFVEGGKASSPLVAYLRKHVPDAVEVSVFNPDEVKIVFPIEVPGKPLTKADVTAVEHLDMIKLLQENWVMPGTNRGTLVNNVSNTVQVRDTEWEAVADKLWRHRDVFAGVALLGKTGDLDYQQAPFVAVDEDDQDPRRQAVNARWKALSEAWPVLDFTEVEEATDQTSGTEVIACGGGACEI